MTAARCLLLTILLVVPVSLAGQVVRGAARDVDSGRPIESGVVTLLDADGAAIRAMLTDSAGQFAIRAPGPGRYHLRFERLGFLPTTTDRFALDEGESESQVISAKAVTVSLERIVITDSPRCRVLREADTLTARVWSAVRGVLASAAAGESGLYPNMTIERYVRDFDQMRRLVTQDRRWRTTGASKSPFVAVSARELEKKGFAVRDRDTVTFYAPDASTLIAEEFLRTHCFRVRDDRAERGRVGLEIEPVPGRTLPDIKGTLWLAAESGELRRLEFAYVNLPEVVPPGSADGWVEFRRLPRGAWVVDRWALRLPLVGMPPAAAPVPGVDPAAGRHRRWLGTHEEGGVLISLEADPSSQIKPESRGAIVRGSVHTAKGEPVAGARAFLSGTGYSAVTDDDGSFVMRDVSAGRYRLSLTHPRLDTLGVMAPVVEISADGQGDHRLAVPADDEIARQVCAARGDTTVNRRTTLLYGYVREAGSRAVVQRAKITIRWQRATVSAAGVEVRTQTVTTESDAAGQYFICGIPPGLSVTVRATLPGTRRGGEQPVGPLDAPVTRLDVEVEDGRP
ncbi:MAG TPA: carboxypeptidase-like regulatory domain-containing protein [Gemmatimonadaceae bacterium]|nr:carboxypeptidase-like regulatory domain-containing protein [Gemmatimonadaceae bacterium]